MTITEEGGDYFNFAVTVVFAQNSTLKWPQNLLWFGGILVLSKSFCSTLGLAKVKDTQQFCGMKTGVGQSSTEPINYL